METITRKSLLYKSSLGFYCINHVQGCSHGCKYPCYAFMMAQSYQKTKSYSDWCQPKLVSNALELLQMELTRMKTKPESIHLCLSTDPFMAGYDEIIELSLQLITLINSYAIPCSILTKGRLPAELANTSVYSPENLYGISLVSLNEQFRKHWEPGTAAYSDRIASLRYLHDQGLKTRVHIEPYPIPQIVEQNVIQLLEKVKFVDEIFIGRWNYNKGIKETENYDAFYQTTFKTAGEFCRNQNIKFNCG